MNNWKYDDQFEHRYLGFINTAMATQVKLRSLKDRIRYTVIFETILLIMLVPAGMAFYDRAFFDIGLLGVILVLKAMIINVIYNWVFDRIEARTGRVASDRPHKLRVVHAIGFEVTLAITSIPIYTWWLHITVLEAILIDVVVTTFIVGYTYVYTLAYDFIFPVR